MVWIMSNGLNYVKWFELCQMVWIMVLKIWFELCKMVWIMSNGLIYVKWFEFCQMVWIMFIKIWYELCQMVWIMSNGWKMVKVILMLKEHSISNCHRTKGDAYLRIG